MHSRTGQRGMRQTHAQGRDGTSNQIIPDRDDLSCWGCSSTTSLDGPERSIQRLQGSPVKAQALEVRVEWRVDRQHQRLASRPCEPRYGGVGDRSGRRDRQPARGRIGRRCATDCSRPTARGPRERPARWCGRGPVRRRSSASVRRQPHAVLDFAHAPEVVDALDARDRLTAHVGDGGGDQLTAYVRDGGGDRSLPREARAARRADVCDRLCGDRDASLADDLADLAQPAASLRPVAPRTSASISFRATRSTPGSSPGSTRGSSTPRPVKRRR